MVIRSLAKSLYQCAAGAKRVRMQMPANVDSYVFMYVCMYVCMYVYMCIDRNAYTHI
jgi:hypothetical protein